MSQDIDRTHPAVGRKLFLGCLAVILLASLLASLIQSSFGRVQVTGLNIPTQNGQWLAADLFKPKAATTSTPQKGVC